MIELAPNSKTGLALSSPFILGSGAIGWGQEWPSGVEPRWFGAFVTPPLTLQARRGASGPRLAEIPGGFILNTGDHNPGLRRVFRDDIEGWDALDLPVIVALSGSTPDDWLKLAERLDDTAGPGAGIAGLEAHLPPGITPHEAGTWIANLKRGCQLPILVKLRATQALPQAEAVAAAGADVLVVATPPHAAAPTPDGVLVEGPVGGPAAFPFTLRALRGIAEMGLGLPIVASGGITSEEDVRRCLQFGADAIQLRSILWTSPASVEGIIGHRAD